MDGDLGADLDALLLGEPLTLDRSDVERLSGVPADVARDVWTAMGFAEIPYGEKAFTHADVKALTTSVELLELGVVDLDTTLVMARAMGQGLARLAEAQVDVLRARSAEQSVEEALTELASRADEVLPRLDDLMLFMWRRQFAAAVQRSIATVREHGMPVLAVGFVDIVGFTRSTRTWDASQLERTLERFERDIALRVVAVGGRIIKTLGDGVLFTTDRPADAVRVALEAVQQHELDPALPEVRGGVACGPVLLRLGDVFGEPVNIASRLSSEARPGSVLVDSHVADALGPDLQATQLHRRSVRGYRALTPYVVRGQAGGDATGGAG